MDSYDVAAGGAAGLAKAAIIGPTYCLRSRVQYGHVWVPAP